MAAAKSSGMQLPELAMLLRTHFPRGTKSFRWVNDLFGGTDVPVLGGDEVAFGVFLTALKSPSDASFKKAQAALEKGAGGKPTAAPRPRPTAPKPRPTTPKPPKAPKFIRLGTGRSWSPGAKSAVKRWNAAVDRGSDPVEATRRRIAATKDKDKLAGIVTMLSGVKPKAGDLPTRAQIKSLAQAAEKKAGFKPKPSAKPPKKPPTKPPKPAVIKKVKAAQRVDLATFPLLGANWNSKVSTKSPVDNFTRSALRMRSKDKLKEAISLLKTVGSGAKGKERSVFQGAIKLIKDRLKAVSPRATVPGKKPASALAGKPSAKPPKKPKKPKKPPKPPKRAATPTKRRAVAHAAKRMGVEAALRRGLKRGEKVQVQLDLTFTEA